VQRTALRSGARYNGIRWQAIFRFHLSRRAVKSGGSLEEIKMKDVIAARIRAHEGNLQRYCRLLATELTDTEREFIHNRIAEERAELERLAAGATDLLETAIVAGDSRVLRPATSS